MVRYCARYCFDAGFIMFLRRIVFFAWYFPAIGPLTPIKVGFSPFAVKFRSRKFSPWPDVLFGCIGDARFERGWTPEVAEYGGFSFCSVAWYEWSTDMGLIGPDLSRFLLVNMLVQSHSVLCSVHVYCVYALVCVLVLGLGPICLSWFRPSPGVFGSGHLRVLI